MTLRELIVAIMRGMSAHGGHAPSLILMDGPTQKAISLEMMKMMNEPPPDFMPISVKGVQIMVINDCPTPMLAWEIGK